ncbi:NAD(P)H azoreductase [Diplonema papillatum]|nr:NAD(P)H azoreductase [Diplonema papillatum]
MASLKVLITQPTGRVGRECIAHLAAARKSGRDVFIRAAVRTASKGESMKQLGADEVVTFDYAKPDTFASALDGMKQVFSANPDPEADGHAVFCKAVGAVGSVEHAVRLSCFGADDLTASYDWDVHSSLEGEKVPGMLRGYWRDEKVLIDSLGKEKTSVLRGNFFQGHIIKPDAENMQKHGFFQSPLGSTKNSFVSTNDLGEAAALLLLEGAAKHGNKFYDITGPVPMSMYDVAADMTKAMGRQVEYRPQDIDEFAKDFGPQRRAFFEYLRNGFYTRCSPDFYNITGRKPQAFIDYLQQPGKAGETGLQEIFKAGGLWAKGKNVMEGHEE